MHEKSQGKRHEFMTFELRARVCGGFAGVRQERDEAEGRQAEKAAQAKAL